MPAGMLLLIMRYFIVFFLSYIIIINPAISQELSLEEILDKTRKTVQAERDKIDTCVYEYTEKTVFTKLDKTGHADKADTVIQRVKMKGYERLSQETIYSSSNDKKEEKRSRKKKDNGKGFSIAIDVELSADNPDYVFELVDETDQLYVILITPLKKKPDKGQVKGKYFIDKDRFLIKTMDLEIPRPKKVKEMWMRLEFDKLDNGLYVMTDMEMQGRVKILFGVINIRFKVLGGFYDYEVLGKAEPEITK